MDEHFKDLVVKKLAGQLTDEEETMLNEWLKRSDENKDYFDSMRHLWLAASVILDNKHYSAEVAWKKVQPAIRKNAGRHFNITFIARVAAFWVLAFFLGGFSAYIYFHNEIAISSLIHQKEIIIEAPLGGKSHVYLPDGSKAWLNAGSKLSYSQSFGAKERAVLLEGEAYFDVETDAAKPFVVQAEDINIIAHGTAFNVKAYPEEGTITATLEEGSITVKATDRAAHKFEVGLRPGYTVIYTKNPASADVPNPIVKKIETGLYTSWKDDKWVIEGESLGDLAVKLERRFNMEFVFRSESLKKFKLSGTIKQETLDQILDIMKLTIPLKYTISDGVVTLELDEARTKNYLNEIN